MSSKNTKTSSKQSSGAKSSKGTIPGFTFVQKKEHVTEYLLAKNGLRVLSVHVKNSPTVTTNIVYNVGSRHEGAGETGLAHMLEHMLFKKTKTGELPWKKLEDKGAVMNATTWLDRTMYFFNMPRVYLEEMLAVEADRMRNVVFTDEEFLPERANVLSEFEMYNSRPDVALDWNIAAAAFQAHTYKHDTIGFRGDIEQFTVEQLKQFYDTYYWPHNATLIVVGDIPETELLTLIKKHFEPIVAPHQQIKDRTVVEPQQEGERRVTLMRETPIRTMTFAFKAPAFTHKDWPALLGALTYLGDGDTSPLYKALVTTGLATAVSTSIAPTKESYLATISVSVAEKTPYTRIETVVFDTINSALHKKPLDAKKHAEVTTELKTAEILARDGTLRIANNLAECVATGDWTRYCTYLGSLDALTAAHITEAARMYLNRSQVTIGTLIPKTV